MSTHIRTTIGRLPKLLQKEEERIQDAIDGAIRRTANRAVHPIRSRVPVAFGELKASIKGKSDVEHPRTVVTAPHAAAVERGSKPHKPDFEKLLAWVKLRGMQGLTGRGRIRKRYSRSEGPTTPRQAQRVARMFREREVRGLRAAPNQGRAATGRYSGIDSPEEVTKRISKGIEKHGTAPHFFVLKSLPDIRAILHEEMKRRVYSRERSARLAANRNGGGFPGTDE